MNKELKGEIAVFISCIFFALIAISVRQVPEFDGFFISLLKFAFGIVMGILALKILRKKWKVVDKKIWILRGLFGAAAMTIYFVSIQMNGSGRATLLTYTYPIFVVIFGKLFFNHKVVIKEVIGILIALIGVFTVFYDGSGLSLTGDILGLIAGALTGMSMNYVKESRMKNDPIIVYMAACVFGVIFSMWTAPQVTNLTLKPFLWILLIAALTFAAQMFRGWGFYHVTSSRGSIIGFTTIILTILFSYLLGEAMNTQFFVGGLLILTGLVVSKIRTEHKDIGDRI